jgi:hypothetical protein
MSVEQLKRSMVGKSHPQLGSLQDHPGFDGNFSAFLKGDNAVDTDFTRSEDQIPAI